MEPRQRQTRILDEREAASWIRDGMTVAVGAPPPMALLRQLIRRGVKDLTVIDAGISLDLLITAGCVAKVVSYYAGGGFGVPVAPSFRRAADHPRYPVPPAPDQPPCTQV